MMLRLRPYKENDAEQILSWSIDEKAFYKWTAGVLGSYPLSKEQFNAVNNLMAFTAINDSVGFKDIVLEKIEKYTVLGEEWKCLELELYL